MSRKHADKMALIEPLPLIQLKLLEMMLESLSRNLKKISKK